MTAAFEYDKAGHDVAALKRSIANKLVYAVGKDSTAASQEDWLAATFLAVRDRLVERWMQTTRLQYQQDVKRIYYLSMEFLIGRALDNALLALDVRQEVKQALAELGVTLQNIEDLEHDAALGNGGLGRLAACFLDSMATLGLPGFGYGIRYDYGMFQQHIVDGNQVEKPDYWLKAGNPWEFPRPEVIYRVRFGGRLTRQGDKVAWVDTHDVEAMAYDTIIPGYKTLATNTLRLWSARATAEFDLHKFNQGDYLAAVEERNMTENVSRVLYPDDSTNQGRELRLRQEYFFVSASLQDVVHRYLRTHKTFEQLPQKIAIHLNDTHPVLAIPELMRLLVDEHHLPWQAAWAMCQMIFSFTNHTLMSEALETWPLEMLQRVLPRHLQIIMEINAHFLGEVRLTHGEHFDLLPRLSLIDESGERRVRMAWLAVLASHTVNGVSRLHSDLMVQSIFADFARIFPQRFCNKTNGITPRRWLAQANPPLSALIDNSIGPGWRTELDALAQLQPSAQDADFLAAFRAAKHQNKIRLAELIEHTLQIRVDPASLFDVQIKRIHEYKRQLLNVLHVIARYNRILENPQADEVPRTVIFAGKAASAYRMAKLIIRLINDVAKTVNNDPRVGDRLKVVFLPNYGVSLAEIIIPAADLSEQISTAGTEASGTGNMKLALNGALTIGTLDGANVEIRERVGGDNIFIFGHTIEEVVRLRHEGYHPQEVCRNNPELTKVLNRIASGYFSPEDPDRYRPIYDTLLGEDRYLLLADFASYISTQAAVDALYRSEDWTRKAVLNVAGMGFFSADRTISEYAREIWHVGPMQLQALENAGEN